MRKVPPNAEPVQLSKEQVRGWRMHIARTVLESTPREEWDRYVLDTEPETAALLNASKANLRRLRGAMFLP